MAAATTQPTEDITQVWAGCHPHLRPMERRLPIPPSELDACAQCGARQAVPLLTHLRLGDDCWVEEAIVLYCFGCARYSLPAEQSRYSQGLIEQRRALEAEVGRPLPVTAVDARLWTQAPTCINLEPTTRCNFNCWYCVGRSMKQQDLSFEDFQRVLENFPSVKMIYLTGEGEPLLNKRFFDMVALAKARGLFVFMLSNGSAFTPRNIESLCRLGVDYVSISIDSIDRQRFRESRVDGELDKVLDGISRLARYKKEHGYSRPLLGLRGTLFPHTRDELPAIILKAKEIGMDVLDVFQPLNPKKSYASIYPEHARSWLGRSAEVEQAIVASYDNDALPFLYRLGDQLFPGVDLLPREQRTPRASCDEHWLCALSDGGITPCGFIKSSPGPDWNLARNPVERILRSEQYENLRFNLFNGIFLTDCEGCFKTPPTPPAA